MKSNPEYLGMLAIVHCDRLLKILFMPGRGHMRIENYLQANDIRKEICIHICIYICACVQETAICIR